VAENQPIRVVLVEDEEAVCRLLEGYLRRAGCLVTSYPNAQPLLAELQDAALLCDVAVVDLSLPDLPGEQVAARLLAALPSVRVVVTSGLPWDPRSLPQGQGRVSFLQKPFRPAQLLELVQAG